jgi:hypothetical protein
MMNKHCEQREREIQHQLAVADRIIEELKNA